MKFFVIGMTTVSARELNNSTHMEHDGDLTINNSYLYRRAKVIFFFVVVFITINYSPQIFTKPE